VQLADSVIGVLPADVSDLDAISWLRVLAAGVKDESASAQLLARRQAHRLLKAKNVSHVAALLDAAWPPRVLPHTGQAATGAAGKPDAVPWPSAVDGAALLDELARVLDAHVHLPEGASTLIATWIAGTYCFEHWGIFPRLALLSPVKRCGKTTLLGVLGLLVHRHRMTSNITPAALFRIIGQERPTLLIDEADAFLRHNDELRGVLNAGHERHGTVTRCVGDDHEARDFPVFAPAAIAAIGELPSTLDDRSVVIRLQRKPKEVHVARLGRRSVPQALLDLPRKLARWATDNRDALLACEPSVPAHLDDRAADNAYPLLAIAGTAGDAWPSRVQAALRCLRPDGSDDSEFRTQLLADIRDIFLAKGTDRIATSELVASLCDLEERPWAEFSHGRPLSAPQLARLLRPFKIRPGTIRVEHGQTPKGYYREAFEDAFHRYLSPAGAATPPHCGPDRDSQGASSRSANLPSNQDTRSEPVSNGHPAPLWRRGASPPQEIQEDYDLAERRAIQEEGQE
jgi:putative DNA primase/helicase